MQFKSRKILYIIFGAWIALVALVILFLSVLFKSNMIENIVFSNIGLKYDSKDLKTSFDARFNFNISADTINIYNKDKKINFIQLNDFNMSLKPLPLLIKKVNISKLNADSALINLKIDDNGELDLLQALNFDIKKYNNFKITKLNSNINNITLDLKSKNDINNATKILLSNSDIKISKRKNVFSIKEQGIIENNFDKTKQLSDINLDINSDYTLDKPIIKANVNNFNLCILSNIVRKYISKDIKFFDATTDINIETNDTHKLNIEIKNPKFKFDNNKIINPYKKISLSADFLANKNKISINNFDIKSEELFVGLKGEVIKPFTKKPNTEISAEIKNTQINKLINFIPDNAIFYNPKGIPVLKQSNFHAIANGNIVLKLLPLDITGNIKIENIHIPNYPKPYRQNDATLLFMKDKMRLYTRVYTPDNEYVVVDGISNLDDSLYGKYSIKSTKKIDLNFAQMYLVPIQQIIGFNIGPVPIMDIDGFGNIDIKTQGTVKDAQIFGQFNAFDAKAKIHGLDAYLTNGNCKLIFDNRNLIFKEFKGNLEGANFFLSGIGNTKGEVDLNVKIKDAYFSKILRTFNNSVLTQKYNSALKSISAVSGYTNSEINLSGTIKDYEKEDFLNDLALSGNIELKNNKIIFNNSIGINNLSGILNFSDKKNQSGSFEFLVNNSKFNILFEAKESLSKIASGEHFSTFITLNSQKCAFSDIVESVKHSKLLDQESAFALNNFNDIDFYSKISLNSNAKISLKNPVLENFKTNGYIVGLNSQANKNIKFDHGLIRIVDNNIIFDNFKATLFDGFIHANGSSDNDLKISINNLNLEKFEKLLPKIKLQNAILKSGEILIHKNDIKLNAINIDYNKMPIVLNLYYKINGKIFDAVFSTIANEETADYIINPFLSYPVKIKGEIPIKGKFSGSLQDYSIDFTTTIPKEADISFSGANIGDTSQDREISGKINVSHNILSLNNLKLIKYIKNQNNKLNPIIALNLNGKAIQKDNQIYYNNLKIATQSPINVRILNLIFKKSILKKGNFECNITLNGNIQSPELIGKIDLQDLDIPLYDAQINNIKINISPSYIDASIAAKNKTSDIKTYLKAKNSFKAPYIIDKLSVTSNKIDILDLIQSIPNQNNKSDIVKKQDFIFKPEDVIIKNGSFEINDVSFDKINAQNLAGNFSYKDEVFDLKDIAFDIAKGKINAKGSYSIKSTKLNLTADMQECDSNMLAKDFLNISGQIYGKMTGKLNLSAKNINKPEGIRSVESNVDFSINNGKMPKLGSLEYLLRAGNVLRNGVLGLSLNNLIQVLTPYKTGEFEQISGSLDISEGEVKNLEILSKGKNLSMYLSGNYNVLENFADIQIYGRLSQNVSTALGAVGNASIKQFINSFSHKLDPAKHDHIQEYLDKIPLVDSSDQGGYFSAKVFGDINKDNYIKKFNWE